MLPSMRRRPCLGTESETTTERERSPENGIAMLQMRMAHIYVDRGSPRGGRGSLCLHIGGSEGAIGLREAYRVCVYA